MNIKPTVYIKTHGCKLNQSDTLTLNNEFHANGYELTHNEQDADVVVLNTCTVTSTADSKARQYINTTTRKHPDALVVITGCYAQSQSKQLTEMYTNCLVLGNEDKPNLVAKVSEKIGQTELDIPSFLPNLNKTRAMVKIQEGCNQVCAYCIVPKVRGREKSIPVHHIISQINKYHSQGFQEVVLTGTQLGTYGFETPGTTLRYLLEEILQSTSIPRIRVSSLQAHEIDSSLLLLWQDQRLQNHLHIPLQSGDNAVLENMRRKYTTEEFKTAVEMTREIINDVSITTDWIIGFPGETDEQFKNSVSFVKSTKFADIHPFTYSTRAGTSAAYMNMHVSATVKKTRMSLALHLKSASSMAFKQSMIGKQFPVLWESYDKNEHAIGYTANYISVNGTGTRNNNVITNEVLQELKDDGTVLC